MSVLIIGGVIIYGAVKRHMEHKRLKDIVAIQNAERYNKLLKYEAKRQVRKQQLLYGPQQFGMDGMSGMPSMTGMSGMPSMTGMSSMAGMSNMAAYVYDEDSLSDSDLAMPPRNYTYPRIEGNNPRGRSYSRARQLNSYPHRPRQKSRYQRDTRLGDFEEEGYLSDEHQRRQRSRPPQQRRLGKSRTRNHQSSFDDEGYHSSWNEKPSRSRKPGSRPPQDREYWSDDNEEDDEEDAASLGSNESFLDQYGYPKDKSRKWRLENGNRAVAYPPGNKPLQKHHNEPPASQAPAHPVQDPSAFQQSAVASEPPPPYGH